MEVGTPGHTGGVEEAGGREAKGVLDIFLPRDIQIPVMLDVLAIRSVESSNFLIQHLSLPIELGVGILKKQ